MKILIVFIGILLMFTEFMVFQSDMNRYIRTREYIGMIAGECAEIIADNMHYNEPWPGDALAIADEDIKKIINGANANLDGLATEPLIYEIEFVDPDIQDGSSRITGGEYQDAAAIVKLSAHVNDFFRLPFLSMTSIEQVSVRYLLVPGA